MVFIRRLLLSLFLSLLLDVVACGSDISDKCDTCRDIVKKFKEGLVKTAKSNFGGGNTQWEEKNLGSYAFSETRFLEITEKVCLSDDGKEERKCHYMLEANEEILEDWWFRHYAKGTDTDLQEYLCLKKLAVCCPSGTFGPKCKDCDGGRRRPCLGNGRCEGDGTRGGTGACTCNLGYQGTLCDECMDGFYEDIKNDTHTECRACHASCKLTCSDEGPGGCDECRDGWQMMDGDRGCVDLDECEDVSMCGVNEFCTNTDGSYTCTACNAACGKCSGPGAKDCAECSSKHFRKGTACLPCHQSCANSCVDDSALTCDACAKGWNIASNGACQDVDECAGGEDSLCDEDEYCVNTVGSFKCSTCHSSCSTCFGPGVDGCKECRSGYHRNELNQCVDTDECALTGTCDGVHSACTNTPGSFRCECDKGYVRRGDKCQLQPKEDGKSKSKSETSRKSNGGSKNPNPSGKSGLPPPLKKKLKGNSKQRMSVSREDSMLCAFSMIAFSVVCALLCRSVILQVILSAVFWIYFYWLSAEMERYVIKSSS